MTTRRALPSRELLNKVPEVTLYFWVIKILCTTVGEAAADFLNVNLNFGLSGTSIVTGALLAITLVFQFRASRYIPALYWLTVALVSVFGTLVTDNIGLPLEGSTLIFGVLLAATFMLWYRSERTLSIHSIVTRRRETFYWLTILFTFALGTATGDLMAEVLGLGYVVAGAIVAAMIAITALAWRVGLNAILSFWIIYILTRPLGASIGDYLSQPADQGGLNLGATITSAIFTVAILATVLYLSLTKADVIAAATAARAGRDTVERGGLLHTAVALALILVLGVTGYFWRVATLQGPDATATAVVAGAGPAAPNSPLGDLSKFRTITQNTLDLLNAGNQPGATARVDDLEIAWDDSQAALKPKSAAAWSNIDGKIDTVLRELRSTTRIRPARRLP